jgi:hypothetical protein
MWSRGLKPAALGIISIMSQLLRLRKPEELDAAFDTLPEIHLGSLYDCLDPGASPGGSREKFEKLKKWLLDRPLDQKIAARFLRVQANWQYGLYTSKTSSASSLLDILKTFEASLALVSNDYRTWSGWAYANSRALSHFPDLRSTFALNAISGFLKAAQQRPSDSLEFLCQMFSIFFRYGEEVEFTHADIISLPPSVIVQMIPEIVSHITHNAAAVRAVVQDIIA